MATAGRRAARDGHGTISGHIESSGTDRLKLAQFDVIELNEAFAAQGLAVLRQLGCRMTTRASIRTAAPSHSAIPWAHPAHAWSLPPSTSCNGRMAAMPYARCASVSARNCAGA